MNSPLRLQPDDRRSHPNIDDEGSCIPITRFKHVEDIDSFYEINRKFLQTAYQDINEKKLPRPSILEEYPADGVISYQNFDDFTIMPNPNILPILESEQKALYGKKRKLIQKYRNTLYSWKKEVKMQPSNKDSGVLLKKTPSNILPTKRLDLFFYIRGHPQPHSEIKSERSDPSQRWMFTLAKVPSMNISNTYLNIFALQSHIQSSVHVPASLLDGIGKWWADENQYDPYPQLTMRSIFYSKSQKTDLHLRLLTFLSKAFGVIQENSGIHTGVGGLKPFTEQERILFKEKYLSHPKRFESILKVFPDRSTGDLIQFYYETKKTVAPPYKKWWASSKSIASSSSSHVPLSNSLSTSSPSFLSPINVSPSSGANDAHSRPLLGKKKILIGNSGSTIISNNSTSSFEKLKPIKYNFSWLSERPILTYIDEGGAIMHKLAYWTPMERIVLVDGIMEHGLSLPKLVTLLSDYRKEVSSTPLASPGGLKRRRNETLPQDGSLDGAQGNQHSPPRHHSTPTNVLLNAMNKFISEPFSSLSQPPQTIVSLPSASTPSISISLNSEEEVKLFFDLYADTYALHRFVKKESLFGLSLATDQESTSARVSTFLPVTETPTQIFSQPPARPVSAKGSSITGRKASLPITLSSFNFGYEPVTAKAAHAAHYKLAAPTPSRKFSLCLNTNNYGLFNASGKYPFKYMELRPCAASPPFSARLAEGSPMTNMENQQAPSGHMFIPSSPCPDDLVTHAKPLLGADLSNHPHHADTTIHLKDTNCEITTPSEVASTEAHSTCDVRSNFDPTSAIALSLNSHAEKNLVNEEVSLSIAIGVACDIRTMNNDVSGKNNVPITYTTPIQDDKHFASTVAEDRHGLSTTNK